MRPLLPLLLLLCFLSGTSLYSQIVGEKTPTEYYQKGEAALLKKEAETALRYFNRAIKAKPGFSAALRGRGICYELLRDYSKAAEAYQAALEADSTLSLVLYYETGTALYKAGEPKKALSYFQKYQQLQTDTTFRSHNEDKEAAFEKEYNRKLPSSIRACEVSLDSAKYINITELANLGPNINTKADDYFPFVTNAQDRMLFTRKTDKGDEDLYESRRIDGIWRRASAVKPLNSKKDEGMSTMVRDGRLLFYTVCGREGVLGACDIWQAVFGPDGAVEEVRPLEGFANSESWESQASISCDGSTLYFSSKRQGGLGGTDLWYSQRQADGSWGDPVNLGGKVNTELDEEAPFITNDGQTLYFSSNGHPGMGDQDIFMSWLDEEQQWTSPINLGPPVNSAFRELGFFLTADGRTGYLASDRTESGEGGLDIYSFELDTQLYSQPITFVEGLVIDSVLDMPMQARVQFANREDITVGQDGRFFLCVPADDTLYIEVEKKYFHPYQNKFIIPRWDNKQFYTIELLLRSTIELQPPPKEDKPELVEKAAPKKKAPIKEYSHTIFFAFDETAISFEEQQKLRKFLKPLQGKEAQSITIIGYSDDIGTDTYNLSLSSERAKEAALFVTQNGPRVDRIDMEGKGEITNDRPREQNRRVEVKIKIQE